jgi:HD-GYP domain-containing protein (c-di-GMP phosphodiesterase class II)
MDNAVLPKQLTARARRILEQGRGLLERLRALAAELGMSDGQDSLADGYRQTAAMADAALRMIQTFPDAPSAQLRLCDGIEATIKVADGRAAGLGRALEQRQRERSQIQALGQLLTELHQGGAASWEPVEALAQSLLSEAHQAAPLRFLSGEVGNPTEMIARHGLTTAQVVARIVEQDPELRADANRAVAAALLHDVGMLAVPPEILLRPGPLEDRERRTIERHPRAGADRLLRAFPGAGWLAETVVSHHERLDGTGYPAGLRKVQIPALARFLAVCDVYAALCTARPHRTALDTRTALTDTLLLAEQGRLDWHHGERLLSLSFYPVGSVVELADGAVGMVVATHMGRRDLNTPARPVVALLTDPLGHTLVTPQHVDLAQCEGRSIVRSLQERERTNLLAQRYPELL